MPGLAGGAWFGPDRATFPAVRPPLGQAEARNLAAALPPGGRAPRDGWQGDVALAPAWMVVSFGAVSLNSQVLPLLDAGQRACAITLVVVAPLVSDEALATLLVNDAAGVLGGRVVPLNLEVAEGEGEAPALVEALAAWLGVAAWDGRRGTVQVARVGRVEVKRGVCRVARADGTRGGLTGFPARLARALRLRGSPG